MKSTLLLFLAGLLALNPASAFADQQTFTFGGDTYAAGQATSIAAPVLRDAFAVGNTVSLPAPVPGDAHLAGFDVQSTSDIGGDLYAAGFTVSVGGTVKGDVTAIGNQISLHTTQPIAGNVRAGAANFTLDNGVDGALLVTASTATIVIAAVTRVRTDPARMATTSTLGRSRSPVAAPDDDRPRHPKMYAARIPIGAD